MAVEKPRYGRIIAFYIVAIILFVIVIGYFISNQDSMGRRPGNLVGDGICGNFPEERDQNSCCFNAHEDDVTVACVGNWEYIEGSQECQFVCESAELFCPKDLMDCPDGSQVSRNASNECRFDECL
jgi:hypothetical protein